MRQSLLREGAPMSWDQVHRLELMLRARALALGARGGCCPGCGRAIVDEEECLRLGGVALHSDCLSACVDGR